jgi:hypothetical protein
MIMSLFQQRPLRRWMAVLFALLSTVLAPVRAERVLSIAGPGSTALPSHPSLLFGATQDFAVEFWVRPIEVTTNLGAIFTSGNYPTLTGSDGTNGGWGLYWQSGALHLAIRPSISTAGVAYSGARGQSIPLTVATWHHVVVSALRSGDLTLWVDGVQKDLFTMGSWTYFGRKLEGLGPYRIGADPSGANPFRGSMDELRIWSRTRSASEIANANRDRLALNGSEGSLVAYYRFNESGGPINSLGSLGPLGVTPLAGASLADDPTLSFAPALAPASDFALRFDGVNQSAETPIPGSALAGNELSIEYWYKGSRLQSAVRLQLGTLWVVSPWINGASVNAPLHFINTAGTNAVQVAVCSNVQNPNDGQWHHIAMTWKSGAANGLISYYDGQVVSRAITPAIPIPAIATNVWLGGFNGTSEFLNGTLDEVRIWNRELTAEEVRVHASIPTPRLFGFEAGLVGYFDLNDGTTNGARERISGQTALFRNMTPANRVAQDGVIFRDPVFQKVRNPRAAGLWMGEISLKAVNEAAQGGTNALAAGGQFDLNVLLHVDASGAVRLLKDVTVMQKRNSASNLTQIVLVTDDALLPNFDGVVKRSGRLVGVRHSSAFYSFPGLDLPLEGGVGSAFLLEGDNTVSSALPTNPFRHKFHPQHKDPKDLKGLPYDIHRHIEFQFRDARILPGEGRDRLNGTYRETIRGLHRAPIVVEGDVRLERISLVNKLNDQ